MAFSAEEIRKNRDAFAHKLQTEKSRSDVLHAAESGSFDFVLLDTRGRDAFATAHIPGAWCASLDELERIVPKLPKDREIVTYCWGHD
jgi:rhodanese-related sulfurtransferase